MTEELKQSLVLSADLDFDLQKVADEYVRVLDERAPKFRTIKHSIREPTEEEINDCKKHFQVGEIVYVDDHWETHACNGVKKRIFVLDMEAIESIGVSLINIDKSLNSCIIQKKE